MKTEQGLPVEPETRLEYLIDITIAYPDGGKALGIPDIIHGLRPPCDTHLYNRIYSIDKVCCLLNSRKSSLNLNFLMPTFQIPTSDEEMKNWFYERFIEKEHMLETFYKTSQWPSDAHYYRDSVSHGVGQRDQTSRRVGHNVFRSVVLHLAFLISTYLHVQMFYGVGYLWSQAVQMA